MKEEKKIQEQFELINVVWIICLVCFCFDIYFRKCFNAILEKWGCFEAFWSWLWNAIAISS